MRYVYMHPWKYQSFGLIFPCIRNKGDRKTLIRRKPWELKAWFKIHTIYNSICNQWNRISNSVMLLVPYLPQAKILVMNLKCPKLSPCLIQYFSSYESMDYIPCGLWISNVLCFCYWALYTWRRVKIFHLFRINSFCLCLMDFSIRHCGPSIYLALSVLFMLAHVFPYVVESPLRVGKYDR